MRINYSINYSYGIFIYMSQFKLIIVPYHMNSNNIFHPALMCYKIYYLYFQLDYYFATKNQIHVLVPLMRLLTRIFQFKFISLMKKNLRIIQFGY